MKITFLNVGQGDSILLEWNDEIKTKLAILDCNLLNTENPVIDYLDKSSIDEIELLILSHPHYDHFSGMYKLILHCKNKNIRIKNFIHTCAQVPEYIKTAVLSYSAITELQRLFLLVRSLLDSGLIENAGYINAGTPFDEIKLHKDIYLKILSPTSIELDNYVKNTSLIAPEEDANNNPNANWLSTIFSIYSNDWYVLLTSDSEKFSLVRIDKKNKSILDKKLILGQSPHHGSGRNHNNEFWRKRNRNNNTPIVFSVGRNAYKHPSSECVNFFKKNNFNIFSTNNVGGLIENTISQKTNSELMSKLDLFSQHVNLKNDKLNGNKTFEIKNNSAIYIP